MSLDDVQLTLVDSFSEVEKFMRWLGERRRILGFDIETSGLSLSKDRIRLVQFGDATHGWAVPWDDYAGIVREVMAVYDRPMVAHHGKFDAGFLMREGVNINWPKVHDTMVMAFLANSMGPKSLKGAAALYVDQRARAGDKELKMLMGQSGWDWGTVPITQKAYWGYGALDTVLTALLAEELWPRVQPARQAYDMEMAATRVLTGMELRGVRIDVDYCVSALDDLEHQLSLHLKALHPLNPNSPLQVIEALQALGIELRKRTESGQLSVDDEVLRAIDDPLARTIMAARDTQKLMSAFFRNFLEYRDGDRLHTHFNQLQARTGRMSCSEPALQQVPKSSMVRDAFIALDGNRLLLCDYDNEELRVSAHFARDEEMLSAFREGRDLHTELARRVFDVDEPTSAQRTIGKRGRFSKLYGSGIPKFAKTIGKTEAEAAKVFRTISEMYPTTDQAMALVTRIVRERAAEQKQETGYLDMIDGRQLRVPAAKAYVGWNYLVQGTSAIVMKQALVDIDSYGLGDYLGLSVHDEVYLDVPEADVADAANTVRDAMRRDDFLVPLTASSKIVSRWGDAYREGAA